MRKFHKEEIESEFIIGLLTMAVKQSFHKELRTVFFHGVGFFIVVAGIFEIFFFKSPNDFVQSIFGPLCRHFPFRLIAIIL